MSTLSWFVFIALTVLVVALAILESFSRLTIRKILLDLSFITVGLLIGALLSAPLSKLPGLYGQIMPIIVSMACVMASLLLLGRLIPQIDKGLDAMARLLHTVPIHFPVRHEESLGEVVIDTSVLIDNRIVSIAKTGFLPQRVIIPKFVLSELQNIADSKDGFRRDKGRRGLRALDELKKIKRGEFEVVLDSEDNLEPVDARLVSISQKRNASLITTDYNLNKIASIQGVRVLNINDLSQGLRPELLPGEEIEVRLVHLGKDKTQGVGYLEDGTMIVVESGNKFLEKTVAVKISRSLQTSAGKMYFARIKNA